MPETGFVIEIIALLLALGAAGGFLSGLLGVGGGGIFVPVLFFTMKAFNVGEAHAMHLAVGTSLAVVFATSSTSALGHYRRGAVDIAILKSWGGFIVAGVAVGALFASSVNGEMLKMIFAAITFVISFHMAFGREQAGAPHALSPALQRGLCSAIGMISSMIGVGGAVLTVPMMSYIGTPMHRTIGTGAALGILISLPGTFGYILAGLKDMAALPHWSLGYVNLLAAALIIPASMMMAPVGVSLSHRLPRQKLRRIFALVLIAVSVKMFMSL
jgi:uncharacterized protein